MNEWLHGYQVEIAAVTMFRVIVRARMNDLVRCRSEGSRAHRNGCIGPPTYVDY